MVVDTTLLSAALRIGDGVIAPGEPLQSMLTRFIDVAEAFLEIEAPGAPEAIRDEATVRMASYLYDMPTAGRGNQFANAWRSSGAASLIQRWKSVRVVQ